MTPTQRQEAFNRLIENRAIEMVFQPIWDHRQGQSLGYEALARGPEDSYFQNPFTLFEHARESNQLIELELICANKALSQFKALKLTGKLFINFSPDTLFEIYNRQGLSPFLPFAKNDLRVVFELTEHFPIEIDEQAMTCIKELKQLGIEFAIDDFGAGYAGIKTCFQVQPNYIKLDQFFTQGITDQTQVLEAMESLIGFANSLNSKIIAEGVEHRENYDRLVELKVNYVQGYYIARPSAQPRLQVVPKQSQPIDQSEPYTAESILIKKPSIPSTHPARELLDLMLGDNTMNAAPIIDGDQVLGLVKREDLLAQYSSPFGHSLHQRATVRQMMVTNPVVVDSKMPLSQVGHRLSQHSISGLDATFIITKNSRYVGIGLATDVMRKLSDYKLQLARYANPLTLLPGNVPLHRNFQTLMDTNTPFTVAYFDLNNFKPYNDCCGYERGDKMIQLVAQLLKQYLSAHAHFICHLGGDDFIVIFTKSGWQPILPPLLKAYDQRSRDLYRHEDLVKGGIVSKDRDGKERLFPLVGLAIGITQWLPENGHNLETLGEMASYAKKQAKKQKTSAIYFHEARLTNRLKTVVSN